MKNFSRLLLIPAIAIIALAGFGCASNTPPPPTQSMSQPAPVPPPAPATAVAPVTNAATAPTGKATLKFVRADSEETAGEDGKGANAVDGDPATIWHTQWQDASPPCPHEIVIELVPPTTIKGFTYLPRQDDQVNGTIKDYEFYISDDGNDFGQPVSKGTFENSKDLKTVSFDPKNCRFIKLKALSEVNDAAWTSAAEIGVIPAN
jgi:hypothetical protein